MELTLKYDMRLPGFAPETRTELYRAALDQAVWADEHGFDAVHLSEHHGSSDGYCPSPLVFGGAIAGRTARVAIEVVIPLPLHDPVRLAEDVAVLDVLSGGRVRLMGVAGYVAAEFGMFGKDVDARGALVEESVRVLRGAWSGAPFEHRGHRIRVTPDPVRPGGPTIALGGSTPASARRAARIADSYSPTEARLVDLYAREREKLGLEPLAPRTGGHLAGFVFVSEDPERDWATIAPYAMHENNMYGEWLAAAATPGPFATVSDPEELRASGRYVVLTPEECLARLEGVDRWMIHPLMGGLPPELSWQSLDLIADRVLPLLRH
jgi:alkanesulfonate monooxygenase SsuD/methylene tetrahydromethanopterin reductase-like flavin-dependent oxidoreductase (luciferase family)